MNRNYMHGTAKAYFSAWNSRDVDALASTMADDVTLRDWDVEVTGNTSVVGATANIWRDVPTIHIAIMHISIDEMQNRAYCMLSITNDDNTLNLRVLDVLHFTPEGKILLVDAFKQ